MSSNSDAREILREAEQAGFGVLRTKHGGYAVVDGDTVIARVPANGNGSPHWIKSARRSMRKAMLR